MMIRFGNKRKSVHCRTGLDDDEENSGEYDDNFNNGIIISAATTTTTTTKNTEEEKRIENKRTDVVGTILGDKAVFVPNNNNNNNNNTNESSNTQVTPSYKDQIRFQRSDVSTNQIHNNNNNTTTTRNESQYNNIDSTNVANDNTTNKKSDLYLLDDLTEPNTNTNDDPREPDVPQQPKNETQQQQVQYNEPFNDLSSSKNDAASLNYYSIDTNGSNIDNITNVPFCETNQQQQWIPDLSSSTYQMTDTNSIEFNNNNNNNNTDMNNNTPSRSSANQNTVNNPGGPGPSTDTPTVVAVPVVLVTAQLYDNKNNDNEDSDAINNSNESVNDGNGGDNLPTTINPVPRDGSRTRRKYYVFFCSLFVVIVTLFLIGVGIYLRNDRNKTTNNLNSSNSEETQISMEPSNIPTTSPTISHTPTIYRKPFQDGTELMQVVDKYLFNTDMDETIATYGPIEAWDVSNVTTFQVLFSSYRTNKVIDFNADLSKWVMRSATNIDSMFSGASKFNADLSKWDVSNVQLIAFLFQGATNFQSDLSRWNVTSAQYMSSMFADAVHFNSDLSKWDVSNVLSMDHMFANAVSLRSDLSQWNVASVTDMSFMFSGASNFVSDLSKWDISRVTALNHFVEKATNFNTDVSKWNTSKVEDYNYAFQLTGSFQGIGIDRWDVRTGIYFNNMFTSARNFDANLSKWDTTNAITMEEMFAETNTFRGIGLEHWNLAKVTNARAMFYNAIQFDCNVSNWDVSNIANMTEMFARTTVFQGIGLDSWQLNETTETMNMFCGASALNKTNIADWNITGSNLFC